MVLRVCSGQNLLNMVDRYMIHDIYETDRGGARGRGPILVMLFYSGI